MRPAAVLLSVATLTFAIACGTKAAPVKEPPVTTVDQRKLDSVIGESMLPGARGVKGALAASDSARARRKLEDSLANTP